ncbi:MAG: ABC transporter permease, partial [Mesorhizobium sp.]
MSATVLHTDVGVSDEKQAAAKSAGRRFGALIVRLGAIA